MELEDDELSPGGGPPLVELEDEELSSGGGPPLVELDDEELSSGGGPPLVELDDDELSSGGGPADESEEDDEKGMRDSVRCPLLPRVEGAASTLRSGRRISRKRENHHVNARRRIQEGIRPLRGFFLNAAARPVR